MLNDVKLALRVSGTTFDGEINDLINAAKAELVLSGVLQAKATDTTNPLIRRAIVYYCKAHFGFDNPDSDRLKTAYEQLKGHLSLSVGYKDDEVV